uniref:hypothetical protein n=1 Tax=Paractinoplanes polyasparticus TaxID=2856853 RepID=UPI001C851812|nr:hypothetical protein [Actinoplanes polyasparticus]
MRLLPRSGPPRVVAATTAVALAAGAAGWMLAAHVKSPADAAAGRQPPSASLITVLVEKRPLTARVTVQASVTYRKATPILLTGSVAPVEGEQPSGQLVTRAAKPGGILHEGDVLMEINGRPVFALTGTVPMYRTLTEGSTGDDVVQVRAAMRRLQPRSGIAASGPMTGGVLAKVAAWYAEHGYRAVQPTAEQVKEQRRLEKVVRTATGSELVDAKTGLAEFRKRTGARIHSGEIVFVPRLPVRLTTVGAKTGTLVSGEVATFADVSLVVDGAVAQEDAKLLKPGQTATLTSSSGRTYRAKVSALGEAVTDRAVPDEKKTDDQGSDKPVTVPFRLTPTGGVKITGLVGQSVRADITVGDTGGAVLAVPVAAVFTRADGQAYLTRQSAVATVQDIPVTTGLATDGYVEVTDEGTSLRAGDRVVVSGP